MAALLLAGGTSGWLAGIARTLVAKSSYERPCLQGERKASGLRSCSSRKRGQIDGWSAMVIR